MRKAYLMFVYSIFFLLLAGLSFLCSKNHPIAPEPKPDPVPCEIVRVEGNWIYEYVSDPSPNHYVHIQNGEEIFNKVTASTIFQVIIESIPGTSKQGDVFETEILKGTSHAKIKIKFLAK